MMKYLLLVTEQNIANLEGLGTPISKPLVPMGSNPFGFIPQVVIRADGETYDGFRPRVGVEQPFQMHINPASLPTTVSTVREYLNDRVFPVYTYREGNDKRSFSIHVQIVGDKENLEHKL